VTLQNLVSIRRLLASKNTFFSAEPSVRRTMRTACHGRPGQVAPV
jgi:hypothetical protein